jgi:Pyruvate/2-oxoacid:ferredoxin oxidoreductase gamma subunit
VEREVLLSGIGGQGVQLAAHVLAAAAVGEGRDVQLFGSYGGMMRGGNTDATLVVADGRVTSPPTVDSAWAALAMHHEFAGPILSRVRADGLVLLNSSVWEGPVDRTRCTVVDVPATDLAHDAGNVIAAAMVMLGALCTATGVVSLDALHAAARASVPAYRSQHVALNERALDIGAGAIAGLVTGAWPDHAAAGTRP